MNLEKILQTVALFSYFVAGVVLLVRICNKKSVMKFKRKEELTMTQTQVEYLKHLEQQRHNRETEAIQQQQADASTKQADTSAGELDVKREQSTSVQASNYSKVGQSLASLLSAFGLSAGIGKLFKGREAKKAAEELATLKKQVFGADTSTIATGKKSVFANAAKNPKLLAALGVAALGIAGGLKSTAQMDDAIQELLAEGYTDESVIAWTKDPATRNVATRKGTTVDTLKYLYKHSKYNSKGKEENGS